jgi:hypothetical protein
MGFFSDKIKARASQKKFKAEIVGEMKNGDTFSIELIMLGGNKKHIIKQLEDCSFSVGEIKQIK